MSNTLILRRRCNRLGRNCITRYPRRGKSPARQTRLNLARDDPSASSYALTESPGECRDTCSLHSSDDHGCDGASMRLNNGYTSHLLPLHHYTVLDRKCGVTPHDRRFPVPSVVIIKIIPLSSFLPRFCLHISYQPNTYPTQSKYAKQTDQN